MTEEKERTRKRASIRASTGTSTIHTYLLNVPPIRRAQPSQILAWAFPNILGARSRPTMRTCIHPFRDLLRIVEVNDLNVGVGFGGSFSGLLT